MFSRRCKQTVEKNLSTFTTDAAGELDVLWHDGHTLGVDGAKVGIFEETDEVSFAGFLESHDGGALETKISLEVLSDLTDQTLEGEFPQEELSRFLVTADLSEGNCSGPIPVGFFDTSGGRGALASSLGGELFSGSFSSGRFTGGLLGTSHCWLDKLTY